MPQLDISVPRQSLIKFLAEAHRGVQGFVFDPAGMPIERASIKIKGRDVGFQTTKYGEFWRILLPGYYKAEVRKANANTNNRQGFIYNQLSA